MPLLGLGELAARVRAKGAPVVAVDGPAGSGKSTLARRLAPHLPRSSVVKIDDFLSWDDPTGERWWSRLEQQVLVPAFRRGALCYQVRDWEHDELGSGLAGWRAVPAGSLVVLEGVGSARSCVRDRGAFTIWVEAPPALRLERALRRDGDSHRELWLRWMRAEEAIFAQDRTRDAADVRVDGDPHEPHDPATQIVVR